MGGGDSEGVGEIYIIYNFNAVQCLVLGTAQIGANWHDVKKNSSSYQVQYYLFTFGTNYSPYGSTHAY